MNLTENKFSIIIPVHNRIDETERSLRSLDSQTYRNFEVILVNDASSEETKWILDDYALRTSDVKVIHHSTREERVSCRNDGMLAAKNEWICWLDSDDEYMSNYLEICNEAINKWPEYNIFNFGSIIHWHRNENEFGTTIGETFKPAMVGFGHESFKSGKIGTGRFIFNRSILDDVPLLKPAIRPYGDPGCFPELNRNPEYPMREDGQWVPMGNPFGDDYMWFWKITRNHISKPIDMLLYIEHRRP